MFKRKRTSSATIDTLIGPGTRIDGDVEFTGGLHVDGHISGNVRSRGGLEGFLSVSRQGCVEGSVIAPQVILNGVVKGDIEASGKVQLGSSARVLGNVQYAVIESAVGAQINGKLIHRAAPAAQGIDEPGLLEGVAAPTAVL
ncbi:MAG TPA: polymer-forming cytoskeletal protein [Steroidobacteraceae bacterium]|jgi:cytoskeletal protein CcmA (bactofilin family)|nr:polymer-forming cytoskeletal protein [Steroidobacteraceae bacterium]